MKLTENELKEIFSLFTASTNYELKQIYDNKSHHHFLSEKLKEEYELSQSKAEFANDAWRSVLYFLHIHGYILKKNDKEITLDFIKKEFI